MKKILLLLLTFTATTQHSMAQANSRLDKLKIILIRHGEKPLKGDNLTCKGLNRALQLPKVITEKFGVPDHVYVPVITFGEATLHSRMFQTVIPLVAKYNLKVNTTLQEYDYDHIASELKSKTGTTLVCWEHKAIPFIVRALGVNAPSLNWPDDDFDTIYIVTFHNGVPVLTVDKENISPSDKCGF